VWRERGFAVPRVAVNLAARTFESPCLADDLRIAVEAAHISPRDIEIEITETAAMKNVTQTAAALSAIRALGMHTAIDDFGTGYSSLSYLRSFQIDTLKIDRSFVNDIGRNPNVEAICGVIAQLGRAIGAHVVAEGVETDAEATYLRAQGCDDAQGYLFGRPLPAAEFATRWLVASDNIADENFISARAA
jgi:EAL domain-containing protein (putative c-di-GMP-specific phosphodiesterase class I)